MSSLRSGVDGIDRDPSVRPQDDLFRHVNGRWLASAPIPADRARFGTFDELNDEAELAVRSLLEEARTAPAGDARRAADLYASFVDEELCEVRGATPLVATLAAIDAVATRDELVGLVGSLEREGLAGFLQLFVDTDPGDPARYVVMVEQGGISLPDESYYREDHFAPVREAFRAHLERVFALTGLADAPGRAARVMDLETRIAAGHWDAVRSRDQEATYNLRPWADLGAAAGLGPWRERLGAPAHALDEVVVRQPSFAEALGELLTTVDLAAWRDWLAWRVVAGLSPYLSSPFVEAHFDFFGRTLTGTPTQRARWKRGVRFVNGAMGEAVGRLYVKRHFRPEAKARMDELVGHLIEAYRQSITELEWMSPHTRAKALAKLDAFSPKIGYPVRWRDYAALEIDPADLVGNVRRVAAFEFDRQLAKIGGPVDRDEWFMTPQTVNAYYNPGMNEIVFPAAILQPPFFDPTVEDAANFGAIGAVIGHEIGHGFDDQGSKFDGSGRLVDWWEPADREAFEARTARLIAQYDELHPAEVPDQHVNGALTIGENIGDLGGLGIAWRAYQISLAGAPAPEIDGLTGPQRFFLSWARAWRTAVRAEEAARLLAIDPHSPAEFRCNQIVRNLDAYYDAFGVGPQDRAWLDPAERVTIW